MIIVRINRKNGSRSVNKKDGGRSRHGEILGSGGHEKEQEQ